MPQDVRFAVRSMHRSPGFFIGAVLILALGIGLSTATFGVFYTVLIRPLPVADQDRLALFVGEMPGSRTQYMPLSRRMLRDYQRETRTLTGAAGVAYDGPWQWYVRDPADRRQTITLHASVVTANFFDVLGTKPEIGRTLHPADDEVGAPKVMVISYDLWQRQYAGDSSVLDRKVADQSSGDEYRIVGVMPRGLSFERAADTWRPLNAQFPVKADSDLDNIFAMVRVVGRLAPGATLSGAREEFGAFNRRAMAVKNPALAGQLRATAHPFTVEVLGDVRPALEIIAAAVGLLLLMTCVNVANLMLIRATSRVPELAVRASLGATRFRLVRQLISEGFVIAALGGVAGVLIAGVALRALVALAPPELPRIGAARIDTATLTAAIVITSLTVMLFALGPALSASSGDLFAFVRGGARSIAGSRAAGRARRVLVVVQFALALVIVASAGLLGRSLERLQHLNLGFDAAPLDVVELRVPESSNLNAASIIDIIDRLSARVAQVSGVISVGAAIQTPFSNGGIDGWVSAEGESKTQHTSDPFSDLEFVSSSYFQTLGTRILRGRSFDERDARSTTPLVVVSKSVADHYWPGQDVIGKRLGCLGDAQLCSIIGVAENTHYRDLVKPHLTVYRPARQAPDVVFAPRVLLIRTSGDPAQLLPTIRSVVTSTEPLVTIGRALPVQQLLGAPLAQPRLNTMLVSVFALAALVLACVGIFGVLASHVAQRTRELGIRQALGATPASLAAMLLREGLALEAAGIATGLVIAFAVTRALRALLFGVSPSDPLALLGAAALLLVCGLAGVAIPARQAAAVDPSVALRAE